MESANAAPPRKHGRRNYLIDRAFQLKYSLIMVGISSAISLFFGAMMYQAHRDATDVLELQDIAPNLMPRVAEVDSSLLWIVGAVTILMAVTLGLFGVLVTHRIAGPIFVFSQYMAVIGQGRYPMLRPLRKSDELKNFYEVFNQAVVSMKTRDRQDGEALERVAAAIDAAAARSPELAASLKEAAESARAMSKRLLDAAASEDPATPGQKAEAAAKAA